MRQTKCFVIPNPPQADEESLLCRESMGTIEIPHPPEADSE